MCVSLVALLYAAKCSSFGPCRLLREDTHHCSALPALGIGSSVVTTFFTGLIRIDKNISESSQECTDQKNWNWLKKIYLYFWMKISKIQMDIEIKKSFWKSDLVNLTIMQFLWSLQSWLHSKMFLSRPINLLENLPAVCVLFHLVVCMGNQGNVICRLIP